MVTIKDVANAAGVSPTTVSNVIHGYHSRVSEGTSAKILSVIEELGYVPNLSARSLVSRSSHVISMINNVSVENPSDIILNPFHLLAVSQIEASLRESGYYLMFRTCQSGQELKVFLQNWNVDGIFVSGPVKEDFLQVLLETDKPIVLLDSNIHESSLSDVGQDDFTGGYLAARFLLDHGHRKIGYATLSIEHIGSTAKRYEGFCKALQEAGIEPDPSFLFKCDNSHPDSYSEMVSHIREAVSSGMTAIGTSSDHIAMIIRYQLRQLGIGTPDPLSIIGFGDLSQYLPYLAGLTSVHYDFQKKAASAVEFMQDLLSGKRTEPGHMVLPVRIIDQGSVRQI